VRDAAYVITTFQQGGLDAYALDIEIPQRYGEDLVPRFTDETSYWFGLGRTGGYLRHCIAWLEAAQKEYQELLEGVRGMPSHRSHEYGSYIVEAMETNQPVSIHGNVLNRGLVTNLPEGCCVEVPCLVDGNGIQPTLVGALPTQLAALNRTMVRMQELIVGAALAGDTETIYHAMALDPLTGAVCTLDQIRDMADEMLAATGPRPPRFD
jgi:alpha-galactosidase